MIEQVYHRGSSKVKPELIRDGVTIFGVTGNFGTNEINGILSVPGVKIYPRDQRNGFVDVPQEGGILFQNNELDSTKDYLRAGGANIAIGSVSKTDNNVQRLGNGGITGSTLTRQDNNGRVIYGFLKSQYSSIVDTSIQYHCYLPQGFDNNGFNSVPIGIRDHVNSILIVQITSGFQVFETITTDNNTPETRTVGGKTISYGGLKYSNVLGREGTVSHFNYLNLV